MSQVSECGPSYLISSTRPGASPSPCLMSIVTAVLALDLALALDFLDLALALDFLDLALALGLIPCYRPA